MKPFAILLLALVPALRAETAPAALLLPGTKVVMGIAVNAIAQSPLTKSALAQATAMRPEVGAEWMKLGSAAGFDPFRDLDEVLIGSTATGQNAPTIVVLRGRFKPKEIDRLSPANVRTSYKGVQLLGGGKGSTSVLALLDASTALAGDARSVRAVIDRGGAVGDAALTARIEAMRSAYDIWAFGEPGAGFAAKAQGPKELESIDSFQFGMRLRDALDINGEVHARTPEDAAKLQASLGMLQMMMSAQMPKDSPVKLDVGMHEGTLKLSLHVPQEELQKTMTARAGSGGGLFGGSLAGRAGGPAAAAPSAASEPVVSKPVSTSGDHNAGGGTAAFTLPGGK